MNSNKLRKEQRQEQILLSLDRLDYLTREQLQRLHSLKSVHNANRVLRDMSPYLHHMPFYQTRAYYLSKEGRQRVGGQKKRTKTMQIEHYIMRNEAYFYFGSPITWKNEPEIVIPKKVKMQPDAQFTKSKHTYFLEVDNKQSMTENIEKIKKYRDLKDFGAIGEDGKFPTLVWITTNDVRKKRLQKLCDGLEIMVLTYEEIK
jgi:hypothetical protein